MKILPLPGDEDSVCEWLTGLALKREDSLTWKERDALCNALRCAQLKAQWGHKCTYLEPCYYCEWIGKL